MSIGWRSGAGAPTDGDRARHSTGWARRTRPAAVFNLIGYYALGLPLALWLGRPGSLGLTGIWWGLALGLFARPVAFLCSGLMAFAYFIGHAPQGFWPKQNQGELAVLYCWLFLYLAAQGPGAWALDNLRRRNDRPAGGAAQ